MNKKKNKKEKQDLPAAGTSRQPHTHTHHLIFPKLQTRALRDACAASPWWRPGEGAAQRCMDALTLAERVRPDSWLLSGTLTQRSVLKDALSDAAHQSVQRSDVLLLPPLPPPPAPTLFSSSSFHIGYISVTYAILCPDASGSHTTISRS